MSFMRSGRSQQSQGKRSAVRSKKASAAKREWVSTVHDLSIHKATPEELSRRHDMHRSHNRAVAQWELKEKALRCRRNNILSGSPAPLSRASINIIKEVFPEQFQLQDVLAQSDRAMAVVKDLFGDAPRRQTGFPSVTMAPDCGSDYDLPILQKPEAPTQLSLLSQSMMDSQALNELEDSEEENGDQESGPTTSVNLNINTRVNTRKVKAKSSSRAAEMLQWPQSDSKQQGAGDIPPQTPCAFEGTQEQAALNATVKVQRLQSRSEPDVCSTLVTQVLNPDPPHTFSGRKTQLSNASRGRSAESRLDGSALSSLGENRSSLALLQGLLGQVEVELDGLGSEEPRVAPGSERVAGSQNSTQGLTGFSVALVSTLGRLATLIRQRDEAAQEEVKERRRLEEKVKEQGVLIDALTAETLTLREESAVLHSELQQRAGDLEQRLDMLVLALGELGAMGGLGGDEHYHPRHPDSIDTVPPGPSQNPDQSGVSPAVLLSPPRQSDNCPHRRTAEVHSLSLHASSLSGTRSSCDDLQTVSPAPFLSSLPRSIPLSPSLSSRSNPDTSSSDVPSLLSEPSQDAMLSQIAELTRQNALIRSRLGQFQLASPPPGSGDSKGQSSSRGSPRDRTEMSVSVPSTTGRAPPQRRAVRVKEPHEEEQQMQQVTTSPSIQQAVGSEGCGSTVQQRLLELNRQSAAARTRLLELIEQQKQSCSSVSVSPSVSPIPPPSGDWSAEASQLLPEAVDGRLRSSLHKALEESSEAT